MSDIEAAFEEHFRYVYLYILKLSRDEALAEEITSESFLKALSSIDSFKGDCDIRVWLCQIAKNCYFTHRKSSKGSILWKGRISAVLIAFCQSRWKPSFQRKPLWKYSDCFTNWMIRTKRSLCGELSVN